MKVALLMLVPAIAWAHPCPPGTTHHEGMEHSESPRTAHWCWNAAHKVEGTYIVSSPSLPTSVLEVVGQYANGQRHGTWEEWFPNGTRKSERTYATGKLHGPAIEYINGTKISEGEYKSGRRHGRWKQYSHVSGTLLGENQLVDGTGHWREWNVDGTLREQGPLVDDRKHGVWRDYHDNGKLAGTHEYKQGRLDGPFRQLYPNGKKLRTGAYRDGKKHGKWREWNPRGRLIRDS